MSRSDKSLTPPQTELIQHLSTGKSFNEAAELLGISTRTVKRWLELPHVNEAYKAVQLDVATHVREQIKALSSKAVKALEESLALSDIPSVRLKAAQMVLDRIAPAEASDQPLQGHTLYDAHIIQYLQDDELNAIQGYMDLAQQRMAQAQADRETLERKRA